MRLILLSFCKTTCYLYPLDLLFICSAKFAMYISLLVNLLYQLSQIIQELLCAFYLSKSGENNLALAHSLLN